MSGGFFSNIPKPAFEIFQYNYIINQRFQKYLQPGFFQ